MRAIQSRSCCPRQPCALVSVRVHRASRSVYVRGGGESCLRASVERYACIVCSQLVPSTCVLVFDVVYGLILSYSSTYTFTYLSRELYHGPRVHVCTFTRMYSSEQRPRDHCTLPKLAHGVESRWLCEWMHEARIRILSSATGLKRFSSVIQRRRGQEVQRSTACGNGPKMNDASRSSMLMCGKPQVLQSRQLNGSYSARRCRARHALPALGVVDDLLWRQTRRSAPVGLGQPNDQRSVLAPPDIGTRCRQHHHSQWVESTMSHGSLTTMIGTTRPPSDEATCLLVIVAASKCSRVCVCVFTVRDCTSL